MKVLTVVGNRPQFVKAAAVSRRLVARCTELLIHTGQHYDPELSAVFFEELDLPPPARNLGVGSGTHAQQTGRVLSSLAPLLAEERPDGVLVYGDTNSTLGGALAAAQANVPLVHVEAGMRSHDRSMPEEVNRVLADHAADLLLCSTPTAVSNLDREGLADRARLVGDVMADVAIALGPIAERRSSVLARLELEPRGFILATVHRAGTVDSPERLRGAVGVLAAAASVAPVVFPIHPHTAVALSRAGLESELVAAGVRLTESFGYLDTACLLRAAAALLTDSGGLQKEAYLAGTPCVTLREETEWVETVASGWNRLAGLDPDRVRAALEAAARERPPAPPDLGVYGGGDAAERAASELVGWLESL